MVSISRKEDLQSDEITLTIQFDPENAADQFFKKALIASFDDDRRQEYLMNGHSSACLDFGVEGNTVTLSGLGDHMNAHFHSPPLVLPQGCQQSEFWAVGDEIYAKGVSGYRGSDGKTQISDHHKDTYDKVKAIQAELLEKAEIKGFIEEISALNQNGIKPLVYDEHVFLPSSGTMHNLRDASFVEKVRGHEKYHDIKKSFELLVKEANPSQDITKSR